MRHLAAVLLLATAAPAGADLVLLDNGNSFEGVVTEVTASQVRLRLAYGELTLPLSLVRRIERSATDLEEYFARADRLSDLEPAAAADWLELAGWATRRGIEHGAIQAAKTAARLDPHLEGLAPRMRALGYVLDEELDRWMPYEELMRRRGFLLLEGEWISADELAARDRAREAISRQREAAAREERLAQAVELLALSQVERVREPREAPPALVVPSYGYPVAVFPAGWFEPGHVRAVHDLPEEPPNHRQGPSVLEQLLRRQPGSVIPLRPPRRVHHGSIGQR